MFTRAMIFCTVASMMLASTAFAATDAGQVTFFLPRDGETMSTAHPTNDDPTGLMTLHIEHDGRVYSTRTDELAHDLRIARDGSFRVHLDDRKSYEPGESTFITRIALAVHNGAREVLLDHERWHLAEATASSTQGGVDSHTEGWTDFSFDAASVLPDAWHCNAHGCIHFDGDALIIPRGMRVALEIGLVSPGCAQDLCDTSGAWVRDVRGTTYDALNATGDTTCDVGPTGCVNPYNPLIDVFGPNADVATRFLNATLRPYEDGSVLTHVISPTRLPRSSWQTASTTSDSRIEIRIA